MKSYSTNEVCQMCNASRKQSRYYEEHGLLSPASRNDVNNYRYYTQQYLYVIVVVKALRNIDISLTETKDIIYGRDVEAIQRSIRKQVITSREVLEESIIHYEQSTLEYTKPVEAISVLKIHNLKAETDHHYEVMDRPAQSVTSLRHRTDFEDADGSDMDYLPLIQTKAQSVSVASLGTGALMYITYDYFDSDSCSLNNQVHDFKIAVPVADAGPYIQHCDHIPALQGVSTIHIGSPKNGRLYQTYMNLLKWAKTQGYRLENWSVEEWLISPMITNSSGPWMIRVMVSFRGTWIQA